MDKLFKNIKGDLALNYKTIPIVYGEKTSKIMLNILTVLTLIPAYFLIFKFNIGKMNYFFYLSIALLVLFLLLLQKSNNKPHYLILHNILKFIIVAGVFSIVLIDVNLLLNRIL